MSTATEELAVRRRPLWFGLIGGAIAWTLHLMFAYVIAEFGCVSEFGQRRYLDWSLVTWLELLLTVVTTVVGLAATLIAYRAYSGLRTEEPAENVTVAAAQYTAWAGFLTSGIFTLVIVFESIPILYYLRGC